VVKGVAPLNRAQGEHLSFLADQRYAGQLAECRAGVLLVSPQFVTASEGAKVRIVVDKPYDALVTLLPRFYFPSPRPGGVHQTAVIGDGVELGKDVTVEAYAVVGAGAALGDRAWVGPHCVVAPGVTIGADSHLVSHVTCYSGSRIGQRVTLHAGVRTGSDGFGYAFAAGAHQKILHVGGCIVGDDVEIGANTCIDRGSIDDTVVGAGTKIDNLVHIAHNVRIGRLCLIMAQAGIAGSSQIDDGAIIAGQVGIGGHLHIGAGARLAGQAGVMSDVPAGQTWSGYPARPHKESLRASAALFKLSAMMKRIERLLGDRE
jgi:UDP-3-O-[3-hydroxymyristoyl] glucosamine N-acyltransferase